MTVPYNYMKLTQNRTLLPLK